MIFIWSTVDTQSGAESPQLRPAELSDLLHSPSNSLRTTRPCCRLRTRECASRSDPETTDRERSQPRIRQSFPAPLPEPAAYSHQDRYWVHPGAARSRLLSPSSPDGLGGVRF